jgi:hypothetical protein
MAFKSAFKSAGAWQHEEEERRRAAQDFAAQESIAVKAAREGGKAHAQEEYRLERNRRNWARAGAILAAPFELVFNTVTSIVGGTLTALKYTAGAVVVVGGVSGTIDHLQTPNPDNESTSVRILKLGRDNIESLADDLKLLQTFEDAVRMVQDRLNGIGAPAQGEGTIPTPQGGFERDRPKTQLFHNEAPRYHFPTPQEITPPDGNLPAAPAAPHSGI